ncbi:hypothetical protein ABFX02_11G108600 [Erythranthe guttata]
MGGQASRPNRSSSTRHRPPPPLAAEPPARTISNPNFNSISNSNPSDADMSSYEAACRSDPDLSSFDAAIHRRTSAAINSIAATVDARSLSLDSLRQVTETLLDTNQEVVRIILQNKKDIWKNPELSDLVDDYFENSLLTLDFCTALDACLKRAAHIESVVNIALRKFEHEHHSTATPDNNYSSTLAELRNFNAAAAADPFGEEFFSVFNSVYSKQIVMLERLKSKKSKLDNKLGKLKAWKKVSNVIFVVTFASVLICSVVAAALSAPPVVTALAAAAAVPLGSMGRWINSLWKTYENDLRGQREIIGSMQIGTFIVIKDLESIRVLVDRFRIKIEGLLANADFGTSVEEEEEGGAEVALVAAVEEIRKGVGDFIKTIHDLSEHANKCSHETRMARTLILRRIINHPKNDSNRDVGMFS